MFLSNGRGIQPIIFAANDMDKIASTDKSFGSLYLGNVRAAEDATLLQRNNIRAVLSVIDTSVMNIDKAVARKWIVAEDYEGFSLYDYFEEAITFIDDQTKYTNVLVHCYAGISRSATLVIAYLMKKNNLSLKQAISQVNQCRPIINPNPGFMQQLRRYEQDLNKKKAVVPQNDLISPLNESRFSVSRLSVNRLSQSRQSVPNTQSITSLLSYEQKSSVPQTPTKNKSSLYQPFASLFTPVKSEEKKYKSYLPPRVNEIEDYSSIKDGRYRSSVTSADEISSLKQSFFKSSDIFSRGESSNKGDFFFGKNEMFGKGSQNRGDTTTSSRNQKLAQLQSQIGSLGVGERYKPDSEQRTSQRLQQSLFYRN